TIEVAEPADLLAGFGIFFVSSFFEPPDEHHHLQAVAFDRSIGRAGFLNGRTLFDFVGNSHVGLHPGKGLSARPARVVSVAILRARGECRDFTARFNARTTGRAVYITIGLKTGALRADRSDKRPFPPAGTPFSARVSAIWATSNAARGLPSFRA